MKIEKITVTKQELCEAVHEWMERKHSIKFPVLSVAKDYSYSSEFAVEFEDPEPPAPPRAIAPEPEEPAALPDVQPLNHTLATLDSKA